MRSGLALLALCLTLCGCNVSSSGDSGNQDAQQLVAAFHTKLDHEQYQQIWDESDKLMHDSANEAEMIKLMAVIHRKLGPVKVSNQLGWRENRGSNGHVIEVLMETAFDKGSGKESFVFIENGGTSRLGGYHINSNDMMLN